MINAQIISGLQKMEKSFLTEARILEKNIDIEEAHLNYEETFKVIYDYIHDCIIKYIDSSRWSLSEKAKNKARYYFGNFFDYGDFIEKRRKEIDVSGINDVEEFSGQDKKLIELITFCLWEKNDYLNNVNNYMQDNFFTHILMKSHELDPNLSRAFREFVESHPIMQKYKIKND